MRCWTTRGSSSVRATTRSARKRSRASTHWGHLQCFHGVEQRKQNSVLQKHLRKISIKSFGKHQALTPCGCSRASDRQLSRMSDTQPILLLLESFKQDIVRIRFVVRTVLLMASALASHASLPRTCWTSACSMLMIYLTRRNELGAGALMTVQPISRCGRPLKNSLVECFFRFLRDKPLNGTQRNLSPAACRWPAPFAFRRHEEHCVGAIRASQMFTARKLGQLCLKD